MTLTDAETEEAARRLCRTAGDEWGAASADRRAGYRKVAVDFAATLDVEHSPASVHVFMTWMGDQLPAIP